ncbi:MAG: hypothetical protein ACTHQ3_01005, partial [Motilibacteraceae bacterium]
MPSPYAALPMDEQGIPPQPAPRTTASPAPSDGYSEFAPLPAPPVPSLAGQTPAPQATMPSPYAVLPMGEQGIAPPPAPRPTPSPAPSDGYSEFAPPPAPPSQSPAPQATMPSPYAVLPMGEQGIALPPAPHTPSPSAAYSSFAPLPGPAAEFEPYRSVPMEEVGAPPGPASGYSSFAPVPGRPAAEPSPYSVVPMEQVQQRLEEQAQREEQQQPESPAEQAPALAYSSVEELLPQAPADPDVDRLQQEIDGDPLAGKAFGDQVELKTKAHHNRLVSRLGAGNETEKGASREDLL